MSAEQVILAAADIYDVKPIMRPDDYGSCPCFRIETPELTAQGRCWRASCDYHPDESRRSDGRCCVHVTGSPEVAERLRTLLDDTDWYGGWALELE